MVVNLPVFALRFSGFYRDLRRRSKEFLPRHQKRFERLSQAAIQVSVYDVYSPVSYERTGDLKGSTHAYFPEKGNTKVMFIEPMFEGHTTVSRAKIGSGGYGKYVAGEGPGIGFLARTVPSEFPRDFPEAVHQAVEADAIHRFQATVVDKALTKL